MIAWLTRLFRRPEPPPAPPEPEHEEPGFAPDDIEPPTSRPEVLARMGVGRGAAIALAFLVGFGVGLELGTGEVEVPRNPERELWAALASR